MRVTGAMVRRQAGFARRSLRDIAREPAIARELPRLLATVGRGTMSLELPWLPFRLIDELSEVVTESTRVFEYGGGGSTLWFLRQGASVTTVEHHAAWADRLEASIDDPRWTLLRRDARDDYRDYVEAVSSCGDELFDVVVVDGRERVRCAMAALGHVRPGGLLVFDDVDRARYAAGLDQISWPRRDVVGFAPAKPTLAYTAVLVRPADASA
jgi:hypothetical protein